MSETYTRDNFSPDVVPSRLRADAKALIAEAVDVGWAAHVQSGHGVSLEAPPPNDSASDNPQFIKFSTTERAGAKNMASIRRKVLRFADPELSLDKRDADAEKARRVREREERKAFAKAERKAQRERAKQKESTPVIAEALRDAVESKGRYIVSEKPIVVASGGASLKGYTSESTIERSWSDGSVDYACAVEGCDFTSESRLGPSRGHRRWHVGRGDVAARGKSHVGLSEVDLPKDRRPKKEKSVEFVDELPESQPKSEPTNLVGALKAVLEGGIDWSDVNKAAGILAATAEKWAPKDGNETLDQIRALLDDGESQRQADEIASLRAQNAALEVRATSAEEEAEKAREALRTLGQMAAEYDKEREAS
jgi:hypothetical protein